MLSPYNLTLAYSWAWPKDISEGFFSCFPLKEGLKRTQFKICGSVGEEEEGPFLRFLSVVWNPASEALDFPKEFV